jgi:hypothetical protein
MTFQRLRTEGADMDIVNQFLNFNKLMGQGLVKIVYYLGLACIALMVLFGLLGGLATLTVNFGLGLGTLVGSLIGGVIAVCFLRFACELYIAIFKISDDLSAIRAGGSGLTPKV